MSDYRTWEDFLDEDDAGRQVPDSPLVGSNVNGQPVSRNALPEEIQEYLREYERLREELDRRTGATPQTPEEARLALMYPVKVHTPESRIEERQLRKRDEAQAMFKREALARRRSVEVEAAREDQARIDAERERARRLRLIAAWEERKAEQLQAALHRRQIEERVQRDLDDRVWGALARRTTSASRIEAREWDRRRDEVRERQVAARRDAFRQSKRSGL